MRHHLSGRQLSRNSSHRKALMRNMAAALLRYVPDATPTPVPETAVEEITGQYPVVAPPEEGTRG